MKSARTTAVTRSLAKPLAERIAKDVGECDPAILSLIVMTSSAEIVATYKSSRLAETEYGGEDAAKVFAAMASVILSSMNAASDLLGKAESIVGTYKNFKSLLINLPEYNLALGARIARSANGEYVYSKIQDLLAIS